MHGGREHSRPAGWSIRTYNPSSQAHASRHNKRGDSSCGCGCTAGMPGIGWNGRLRLKWQPGREGCDSGHEMTEGRAARGESNVGSSDLSVSARHPCHHPIPPPIPLSGVSCGVNTDKLGSLPSPSVTRIFCGWLGVEGRDWPAAARNGWGPRPCLGRPCRPCPRCSGLVRC